MPAAKQEPCCDVFISYRRGAADELAMLLQTKLHQHGLKAFVDRDLRRGRFDNTLLNRIAKSPSFLIILTPNALDRCSDEDDWVRKEIVQAFSSKCNIIPLQIDSFQFTPEMVENLDPAVRELSRYQVVEYSRTYFESTIERIVRIVEEDKLERKAVQEAEERRVAGERAEAEKEEQKKNEAERRTEQKAQRRAKGIAGQRPLAQRGDSPGWQKLLRTTGVVVVATVIFASGLWLLQRFGGPKNAKSADQRFVIHTSKGDVSVIDFRKHPLQISADRTSLLIEENNGFSIGFYAPDSSFVITLKAKPLNVMRASAERAFLKDLGISPEDACKLALNVGVPISVDSQAAGRDYGLSFCSSNGPIPSSGKEGVEQPEPALHTTEGTIDLIGTTSLSGKDMFTVILTPPNYKRGSRQPTFAVDGDTVSKYSLGDTVQMEAKAWVGTAAELAGVVVRMVKIVPRDRK